MATVHITPRLPGSTPGYGYEDQANYERWYVADLPGHNGLKRDRSQPNADWGFTTRKERIKC